MQLARIGPEIQNMRMVTGAATTVLTAAYCVSCWAQASPLTPLSRSVLAANDVDHAMETVQLVYASDRYFT
ncbi:MAG TPA: hypothetical protein VFQ91_23995, partial [Bryobacteraceae bacterium]|nr:hypothetical protein [Bryobacteraceae bacterium]